MDEAELQRLGEDYKNILINVHINAGMHVSDDGKIMLSDAESEMQYAKAFLKQSVKNGVLDVNAATQKFLREVTVNSDTTGRHCTEKIMSEYGGKIRKENADYFNNGKIPHGKLEEKNPLYSALLKVMDFFNSITPDLENEVSSEISPSSAISKNRASDRKR